MTKLFFQHNVGHAGGWWMEQICNWRGLKAWAEPHHSRHGFGERGRRSSHPDSILVVEKMVREHMESGKYPAVGTIKGNGKLLKLLSFASVVQVIRHPLSLLEYRLSKYGRLYQEGGLRQPHLDHASKVLGRPLLSVQDYREGHIAVQAKTFSVVLRRRDEGLVTARIEDLNFSIGTDGLYFRRFMEYSTTAEWTEEHWIFVRDHMPPAGDSDRTKQGQLLWPRGRTSWTYDPTPVNVWTEWDERTKELFLHYFEPSLLLRAGYGWP